MLDTKCNTNNGLNSSTSHWKWIRTRKVCMGMDDWISRFCSWGRSRILYVTNRCQSGNGRSIKIEGCSWWWYGPDNIQIFYNRKNVELTTAIMVWTEMALWMSWLITLDLLFIMLPTRMAAIGNDRDGVQSGKGMNITFIKW